MAYGITSESQLMDIDAIRNGCVTYLETLDGFTEAGKAVYDSGNTCDKKALSVDDSSMQPVLNELGVLIAEQANKYAEAANTVYSQAVAIYNEQVAELNAYYQRLAAQQAAKQQNNN